MLEPALKVAPVSAVSDLAASQLTRVSMIPAFSGLVLYNPGSEWGFSTDFRAKAGISSSRHPTSITNAVRVLDSGFVYLFGLLSNPELLRDQALHQQVSLNLRPPPHCQ